MPIKNASTKHAVQKNGDVKSAARTLQLLELLSNEPRPLTLTEIGARIEMPISSLHHLLRTLVARGWLETTPRGSEYMIGVRALLTGMSFIERDPVVQASRPVMNMLREELGETIHLARLDDARVVYLASRESPHQLRTVSRVGQSLPAHASALGKATLARLSDEDVATRFTEPLQRLTPHTIGELSGLLEELKLIRARGWSREREENTLGTGCISVAIPLESLPYAISCSVPLLRMDSSHETVIAQSLQYAAQSVAADLGPRGQQL